MDTATTGPFQLRPAATTDTDAIVDVWFTGWRAAHLDHVPDALLAHRSEQTFRERIGEQVNVPCRRYEKSLRPASCR